MEALKKIIICLIFLSSFSINKANSASLDLGLNFEAGIDDDTIALINALPEKIRKEMYQLLVDAQPLIDQSVMSYLDRIDEIISTHTVNIRCEFQGAIEQALASIKREITGSKPKKISNLVRDWSNIDYGKNTKIIDVILDYADFATEAQNTVCFSATAPEASVEAQLIKNQVARRLIAWQRIRNTCTTFHDCFDKHEKSIIEKLEFADPRDFDAINALKLKEQIKKPKDPFWFFNFDYRPYEEQIILFQQISDALDLAVIKRKSAENKAADLMNNVENLLKDIENKKNAYFSDRRSSSSRHTGNMVRFSQQLKPELKHANTLLNTVLPIEPSQVSRKKALEVKADSLSVNLDKSIAELLRIHNLDTNRLSEPGGGGRR